MNQPSILLVCLGNICRSPTAHAVLREKLRQAGLDWELDSAGTAAYHIGKAPDPRSQDAALSRGYPSADLRARKVAVADFAHYDWILAMDDDNFENLMSLCPEEHQHKVRLFLSFTERADPIVPDPYYGGRRGFEDVLDRVEEGAEALIRALS